MSKRQCFQGSGVSPGIAIGPTYIVRFGLPDVPHRVVPESQVSHEIERLHEAIEHAKQHLMELRERTEKRAGPEEAGIFDAQLMMLEDVEFVPSVERMIRENQLSAERAFEFRILEVRALWAQSGVLRQRRADLFGIGVRVLQRLLGESVEDLLAGRANEPVIVVTGELTPGLTMEFDREEVAGFVSVEGTRTSHAAILAHSLGIPCVMGLVGVLDSVSNDQVVILDGEHGTLVVHPSERDLDAARREDVRRQRLMARVGEVRGLPPVTKDGVEIALRANVDLPEELPLATAHGADGVGLLRTEFLVLGRAELPSEAEQAAYFSRVAERFPGSPIVIRSYDLGGDKFPAAFRPSREPNPFLGWRAIRVCLDEPDIFVTQIKAIMRARLKGDVQLMLPLVTTLEEVQGTRELIRDAHLSLVDDGVPHKEDVPLGVMVETPAAAMIVENLVSEIDFLSVGTNDLTQYTLAIDRGSAGLADRFDSFHPAVVRLLDRVSSVGVTNQLRVSVCGEMASDPLATVLLLSLDYTALSVAPPRLPLLRWMIRQLDVGGLSDVASKVRAASTGAEVRRALEDGLDRFVDPTARPVAAELGCN